MDTRNVCWAQFEGNMTGLPATGGDARAALKPMLHRAAVPRVVAEAPTTTMRA